MSGKARDKRDGGGRGGKVEQEAPTPAGVEFNPPLKPHRGVFILLCVVLAVWVGVLLVMYFRTVYPQRHGGTGKGFSLNTGASRRELVESDFR
jgi:hypothetical protein